MSLRNGSSEISPHDWQLLRLPSRPDGVEHPTSNFRFRPESVSQQVQITKFDKRLVCSSSHG